MKAKYYVLILINDAEKTYIELFNGRYYITYIKPQPVNILMALWLRFIAFPHKTKIEK